MQEQLIRQFRAFSGRDPQFVVRAPGRVNLIGEHTDYNDGFVLPMAIDRAVWIALRPRSDGWVMVRSVDYGESLSFDLSRPEPAGAGWGEYIKGVAWALRDEGYDVTGWEGVMGGDVPRGAGLSSSAAVEMAVARAFAAAGAQDWDPIAMARLGQRVENEWIGMKCGIMDQLVVASARPGHALLIDCRTLDIEAVPIPPQTTVAILDTGTRRGLVDSAYNERRGQCEAAARALGVRALRDADPALLEARAGALDPLALRRARHVVTENARTLAAADALREGDAERLGLLMNESHISLRDDFNVSSPELNAMVDLAQNHPACFGARMTGAGFGGCAVALVETEEASEFVESVNKSYSPRIDLEARIYLCRPGAGTELIPSSRKTLVER